MELYTWADLHTVLLVYKDLALGSKGINMLITSAIFILKTSQELIGIGREDGRIS